MHAGKPLPDAVAKLVERLSPILGDQGIEETLRFKYQSSQTNDLQIDTCHYLARHSALLREGKDWLAQCKDNVTD